jgi:TonB family protein
MRYEFILIPLFLFAWLAAAGQQDAQALRPAGAEPTAPVLLPPNLTVSTPKHCDELDGVVKLAAIIDAAGLPRELKTLEASDRRLVSFATELVEAQRFKPGVIDGSAAAVAVELTAGLHTCAQREKNPTDGNFYQFTLRAHPLIALAVVAPPAAQEIVSVARTEAAVAEQVGGHISAPIPTILSDPEIPISGKFPKRGLCILGVTIDSNGVPQNIHVVRSLELELDNNVIEAVKSWRFKPALRDGSAPVAVEGTVVAMFEYVEKQPVAFAAFTPETPEKVQAAHAHHEMRLPDLEPINADEVIARYMPVSRVSGRCLVSLVIDTNGVPRNVHIIKGLDSSLDLETVAMVEHLRFKPVMKDGTTPVPVGLIVPVRYRKMLEKPTWNDLFNEGLALAIFSLL